MTSSQQFAMQIVLPVLTVMSFALISSSSQAQSTLLSSSSSTAIQATSASLIILTAYSSDGTNTGTARIGHNVTVQASAPGVANATYQWTLTGPGSLSTTGLYSAPSAMPAAASATITATLTSNPAVSASYQVTLLYPVPSIRWIQPTTLLSGIVNAVTIVGYDLSSASTVLVGNAVVAATLSAPGTLVAQVPVPVGATQTLAIQAVNPTPGGGASPAAQAAIKPPTIVLTAYSADGTNSGTARLGRSVTIQANSPGLSAPVYNWSLQGPGSISTAGIYTAPSAMPTANSATVTATLASNTAVSNSYKMSLLYVAPTIRWIQPTVLASGVTNTVTVVGYDFTPATTLLVGNTPVAAVYSASAGTLVAQVAIGNVALNPLSLVAKNPTPGGGSSAAAVATVAPLTIQLSSYNKWGLNPSSSPLGREIQFIAAVQGSGNPALTWPITWTVRGGGTISSTGLYLAPSTMPTSQAVYVTATLSSLSSITSTSYFALLHPTPVVNQSAPTQVEAGQTTTVIFNGAGFEPATQLLVNGSLVASKFLSSSAVSAAIPVDASTIAPLSISAQNPTPGGGTSPAFALSIAGSSAVAATIGTQPGLAIAGDFLGLSHDWNDAQANMGTNQLGVNTIYRRLVANLTNPGWPFFIRIGGGSTDDSVAPTATTVQAFADLANAMPVRFSLGVNLGSNNLQLAEQQASFFVAQMPAGSIEALEIGNEPDLYAASGRRPSTYNLSNYSSELSTWINGIQPNVPSTTRFMGAAWASPWFMQQNFALLEQQQASSIALVSQHFYEGDQSGSTQFPYTYLLKDSTATAYVPQLAAAAATAHLKGQLFRVGEMNSIDDGGLAGVSNTFSSALWSVDTMFEYASAGVDGVNFHGTSGCFYCAFTFGIQSFAGSKVYSLQQVNPLYYGLLFFHEATTNSAHLLPVTLTSTANLKVWATVDQAGTAHVAILNKDLNFSGTVAVTLPGYGAAAVTRMVAPSYRSTVGISIGDQTFDGSIDGTLGGTKTTETMQPTGSVYEVTVQPTSGVLLTLTKP
jgi:hypothetical protein